MKLLRGALLGATVLLGCTRDVEPPLQPAAAIVHAPPRPTAAPRSSAAPRADVGPPSAAEPGLLIIVAARCDHEEKCANVGAGRAYGGRTECERAITTEVAEELGGSECAHGLLRPALEACLEQIRNEDCRSILGALRRITACDHDSLCGK